MMGIFSGLIAVILLGIYINLIWVASRVLHCATHIGCNQYPASLFNDPMTYAMSTIGGLVSAFVISVLAVSNPGAAPAVRLLGPSPSPTAAGIAKWVGNAFLLIWLGAGFWAFMISTYHPKLVPALDDLGHTWLGIAVAAAYSYFGLKPKP